MIHARIVGGRLERQSSGGRAVDETAHVVGAARDVLGGSFVLEDGDGLGASALLDFAAPRAIRGALVRLAVLEKLGLRAAAPALRGRNSVWNAVVVQ